MEFKEKSNCIKDSVYIDDGYTGRNFNRPSFQRMIADIEAGKVGCVITKDLSRLGRNYIEAGSMRLTREKDLFLYRNIVRTKKVKDPPKSSSATHTSSSGARHGGGGGRF